MDRKGVIILIIDTIIASASRKNFAMMVGVYFWK